MINDRVQWIVPDDDQPIVEGLFAEVASRTIMEQAQSHRLSWHECMPDQNARLAVEIIKIIKQIIKIF